MSLAQARTYQTLVFSVMSKLSTGVQQSTPVKRGSKRKKLQSAQRRKRREAPTGESEERHQQEKAKRGTDRGKLQSADREGK